MTVKEVKSAIYGIKKVQRKGKSVYILYKKKRKHKVKPKPKVKHKAKVKHKVKVTKETEGRIFSKTAPFPSQKTKDKPKIKIIKPKEISKELDEQRRLFFTMKNKTETDKKAGIKTTDKVVKTIKNQLDKVEKEQKKEDPDTDKIIKMIMDIKKDIQEEKDIRLKAIKDAKAKEEEEKKKVKEDERKKKEDVDKPEIEKIKKAISTIEKGMGNFRADHVKRILEKPKLSKNDKNKIKAELRRITNLIERKNKLDEFIQDSFNREEEDALLRGKNQLTKKLRDDEKPKEKEETKVDDDEEVIRVKPKKKKVKEETKVDDDEDDFTEIIEKPKKKEKPKVDKPKVDEPVKRTKKQAEAEVIRLNVKKSNIITAKTKELQELNKLGDTPEQSVILDVLEEELKEVNMLINSLVDEFGLDEGAGLGDGGGLYDFEIDKIMKYIPKANFKGVVSADQLGQIKPEKKCSLIYNTDLSSGKGKHWCAINIDVRDNGDKSVEVYDPLGDPVQPIILSGLKTIVDKLKLKEMQKFKYNTVPNQRNDTTSCGFHCIRFLDDRSKGISFVDATHFKEIKQKGQTKKGEAKANKIKREFEYI